MKGNIGQGSNNCPKDLFIGRAQDTGKPTKLENYKVPKFSHTQHPKKKATAEGQWLLDLVANQGFEPRTCGL